MNFGKSTVHCLAPGIGFIIESQYKGDGLTCVHIIYILRTFDRWTDKTNQNFNDK